MFVYLVYQMRPRAFNSRYLLITPIERSSGRVKIVWIRKAFNSLPLEYLFALTSDDIRALVEQLLDADAEAGVQVHLTNIEEQDFAFAFIENEIRSSGCAIGER